MLFLGNKITLYIYINAKSAFFGHHAGKNSGRPELMCETEALCKDGASMKTEDDLHEAFTWKLRQCDECVKNRR